ncbi:hypothetical protein ACHAWF_007024 [Thalassiosira exigua]
MNMAMARSGSGSRRSAAIALCALVAAAAASSAAAFSAPPIAARKPAAEARTSSSLPASAVSAPPSPPPAFSALFGLSLKRSVANQRPLFPVPSVFSPSDARPVILFDGKCNLCNGGVQLVLDYDRASSDPRGNLRVAALQSRVGKVLLARLPPEQREAVLSTDDGGKGGGEFKSIVVAGEDRTWLNSDACVKIGRELRGPLRYLALLASVIPRLIRDPLYKLLSRFRKRLFGEAPECRLWDDNWDTRFVDDALFGGRSESDADPFADPNAVPEKMEEDDDDEEDSEEAPPGSPSLKVGDRARVVSSRPILHTHVSGYEGGSGICSTGLVGTVSRVLERRAYPKNVAVTFDLEDGLSFEAHFFPGQLRRE